MIRRSREIAATVVPVHQKGERLEEKLGTHRSYMTTYRNRAAGPDPGDQLLQ